MSDGDVYFVSSVDREVSMTKTGGATVSLKFAKDDPVLVTDPHMVDSLEAVSGVRRIGLEKAAELGHSKAQAEVAAAAEAKAAEEKAAADAAKAEERAAKTSSSSSASSSSTPAKDGAS